MILTFRPIKVWPDSFDRTTTRRDAAPFTATYQSTLVLLGKELEHLAATDIVLQVDATERDCRLDGQLRADAKVNHPGVILSFTTRRHGALSYPCDRYGANWGSRLPAWQHNLRAIALGLEALRKVERYGIAERGQQYAGYRELGTGIALGAGMTVEQAAALLADAANGATGDTIGVDDVLTDHGAFAYRAAAKVHHPDAGGDPDTFRQLTQARDRLEAHA